MYAELPDDGSTSVLVPVQFSLTPSIDGEVVVRTADHGTGVIARVAFDHTEPPDGFVCG